MSESKEENDNLSTLLKYLNSKLYEDALEFVKNEKGRKWIAESSWDLIPAITQFCDVSKIETENSKRIEVCQEILCEVAKNANPEETFFELLDKFDGHASDVLVTSLLTPVDITLHRLPSKKTQSLEWFLTSLLDNLKEINVDDANKHFVFEKVNQFCLNFIKELRFGQISPHDVTPFFDSKTEKKAHSVLSNFMLEEISFFAEFELNKTLENLIGNLCVLLPSLDIPLLCFMSKTSTEKCEVLDLTFQVLYYMVFCKGVQADKFPAVYSHQFLFCCGTQLTIGLLESEDLGHHDKGLSLFASILSHVSPQSISHEVLASDRHAKLFDAFSKVIVFNPTKAVRQQAVSLLRNYIEAFNPKGRHLFLKHAILTSDQQGVIAFLITLIKEFALQYINSDSNNFFCENLPELICIACELPKVKSNLLFNVADQAVTALSLLRFLSVKDPKPGLLKTGIWELECKLSKSFLNPLSDMLVKSREYLNQQLHEVQQFHEKEGDKKMQSMLNVSVGGETLPEPQFEEEMAGLKEKLNTLDLIDMRVDILKENWGS